MLGNYLLLKRAIQILQPNRISDFPYIAEDDYNFFSYHQKNMSFAFKSQYLRVISISQQMNDMSFSFSTWKQFSHMKVRYSIRIIFLICHTGKGLPVKSLQLGNHNLNPQLLKLCSQRERKGNEGQYIKVQTTIPCRKPCMLALLC